MMTYRPVDGIQEALEAIHVAVHIVAFTGLEYLLRAEYPHSGVRMGCGTGMTLKCCPLNISTGIHSKPGWA